MKRSAIAVPALLGFVLAAFGAESSSDPADNWNQWRGPDGNGGARGTPPLTWGAKQNIKWKTDLPGEGSSTPIVWADQVFVLCATALSRVSDAILEPDPRALTRPPRNVHRFQVVSVRRDSGEIRWLRTAAETVPHEGLHPTHTYAAASPVTDGRCLYVSFGSRGIYCYDLDGALVWERDLGKMRTRYGWGEAASPVLYGNRLIVNWDHEDQSFIVALDAGTGEIVWKRDRNEPTSWATPVIVPHGGRVQVIVNGTDRTRSYDLENGEIIWECGGQTLNVIPSPVVTGGTVVCMSGYKGHAALAIPLDSTGDISDGDRVAWRYDRGTPYVPSPVVAGRWICFTLFNSPILTCLDIETGEPVLKEERLPELGALYASPVAVGNRLYIVDREGVCLVLDRDQSFRAVATNRLDAVIDASPAVAGDQLFLRGRSRLYCIEAR